MQYEWNVHQVEYPSSECIAWVQWWENPLWLCDIHSLFTVRPIHQPSSTSIPIVQYLTELLESATTLIDNNHPSTIPINGARPTYTANQVREGRAVLQLIRYTDCVIIGSGGVIQWYTISIRLLTHLFPHLLGHATFSTMHPPTIPFHTVSCYTDDDCTGLAFRWDFRSLHSIGSFWLALRQWWLRDVMWYNMERRDRQGWQGQRVL